MRSVTVLNDMPTDPIIEAVGCLSRGGNCRHGAPPFELQGRPRDKPITADARSKTANARPLKCFRVKQAYGGKGEPHLLPRFRAMLEMRKPCVGFLTVAIKSAYREPLTKKSRRKDSPLMDFRSGMTSNDSDVGA